MATPAPAQSPEELKSLLAEALALAYIKIKREESTSQRKPVSWLSVSQSLLQSSMLAAVIALCGTLGAMVYSTQQRLFDEQQKSAEGAITATAKMVAASQALIDISDDSWDDTVASLPKDAREAMTAEKRNIWKTYNSSVIEWRVDREKFGLLLVQKRVGSSDVKRVEGEWQTVVTAVDAFSRCATKYNMLVVGNRVNDSDSNRACDDDKKNVEDHLRIFAAFTQTSRSEPWLFR